MNFLRLLSGLLACLPVFAYGQSIPIGQPINTSSHEYNPCISGNGRTMIFEQLYFNEDKSQIMISYQKGGQWSRPEALPGANTDIKTITNGGFFLNQNGNIILFHSARYGGVGSNDIWMIEKTIIGSWSAPVNLAKPVNSSGHEMDPSLSPDGRLLFFTRILPDKKTPSGNPCGKIFMAERSGTSWKTPVEMPAPINKGCDCAGKMLSDGKTFIFSSMRDNSSGYDIYKSKLLDDGTWEKPVPYSFINTPKDDKAASVPAGGSLVYHATMSKATGMDLMRTKIPDTLQPDPVTLLQGNVKNATNNLALVPKIVATNTRTNKIITFPGALDGSYTALIPQDNAYDVAILASIPDYTFQSVFFRNLTNPKYEEKVMDAKLTPTKPGVMIPLNNTTFINNTDTLDTYSNTEINRIYMMLKSHLTMRIEIGVHTAKVESDTIELSGLTVTIVDTIGHYTDTLGFERPKLKYTYTSDNTKAQAMAIAKALIRKGIPVERIVPIGYGDKVPLSPPPANILMNKRVELKIIHE